MPEYLRALAVILFLALTVFVFARGPAVAAAIAPADFDRRRNLWLAITLAAFLAHNFWLFTAATALLIVVFQPREANRVALFFFLVFAVPTLNASIPGLGLIRQLFSLSYLRLLSLLILLPLFVASVRRPAAEREPLGLGDYLIVAYILLTLGIQLLGDSVTNTLRYGFYAFIDIFLPYYVTSRQLRRLGDFRDVLMSFVVAAMILAITGVFEVAKHWLLYSPLDDVLGLEWGLGTYLARGDYLRAVATTGQAIALGFVIAVAGGFHLYLQKLVPSRLAWYAGAGLLGAGLLAPLSRGPWLGAGIILLVFAATSRQPLLSLLKLFLAGLAVATVTLASPLGERIIDHLPFIGTVDAQNVAYRQRLLEMSMTLIRQNPLFGSSRFFDQLEELRQGQGIIDIVNTYLGIALTAGLVGLGLFVSFFAVVGLRLRGAMRALAPDEEELHLLGRSLLATLAGVLVTIVTVSSITVIPLIYWSLAGIATAYARLAARRAAVPAAAPVAMALGQKA